MLGKGIRLTRAGRLALAFSSLASAGVAGAASEPAPKPKPWYERSKVSGYVFGDVYWIAEADDPAVAGHNGMWLRRGYLTFDHTIAEAWAARLRLELNSPGDFKTSAKLTPFVKDAYLEWKGKEHGLLLGLSPSPTWDHLEGFWGYRSIEKTPGDLYRFGSSRDIGIAARGKFSGGKGFYHVMVGNGAGESSEINKGKKAMVSLGVKPTDAVVLSVYGDVESRPGHADRTTGEVFFGLKQGRGRFGAQYLTQRRQTGKDDERTLSVGSLFLVMELTRKASFLARLDHAFDPLAELDKVPYLPLLAERKFDLGIAGVDLKLHDKVSLIPNVEWVRYGAEGGKRPDDVVAARLTMFFQF